jgi:hypothetical protein
VLVSVRMVESSPRRFFLLFLAAFPHPCIVSLILFGIRAALYFDPICCHTSNSVLTVFFVSWKKTENLNVKILHPQMDLEILQIH